jgi:putative SOS response-associated peptidase YedK
VINGRIEDLKQRRLFKGLTDNKRCVLAVNGFYEWKKSASMKKPYYIFNKNEKPLLFACLYNNVKVENDHINEFVILTMESKKDLREIHNRMPVILSEHTKDLWLDPSVSFDKCKPLILKE